MKRQISLLGTMLMAVLLLITGCGEKPTVQPNTQQGEKVENKVITLKVADSLPTSNIISAQGVQVWMKRVEELTGGKVKFQHFPSEQMGKTKDLLQLVRSGTADIAYVASSYVGKGMDLTGAIELPNAVSSSEIGSMTYWKLSQGAALENDFLKNGIRPVWAFALPSYEVWNTKREVKTPNDTKGMKLRTPGGILDSTLNAVGATPVAKPVTELYESLQRGVLDGTAIGAVSVPSYKLDDLLKYTTRGAQLGTFSGTLSINENLWKTLPEDIQKAMLQAGEEIAKSFGKEADDKVNSLMKQFVEQRGLKVHDITPEEMKVWSEFMAPVEKQWIEDMKAKGLDGEKVIAERKNITKEVGGR